MGRKAGYHISFMDYLKACLVPMLLTVILCSDYLLIAYLALREPGGYGPLPKDQGAGLAAPSSFKTILQIPCY